MNQKLKTKLHVWSRGKKKRKGGHKDTFINPIYLEVIIQERETRYTDKDRINEVYK